MKSNILKILLLTFFTLCSFRCYSQDKIIMFATILDGDTIPLYKLKEVTVISSIDLLTPMEIKKNARLIRNVKKVLPYAKKAKVRLLQLNKEMVNLSDKERKKMMKNAEKEIDNEFGDELKRLNFSQGQVLIKLIDRETGSSSYALIRDLRGRFRAFFYQAFARIFGYNLKSTFDPVNNKKDNLIDRIVRSIELGKI